MANPHPEMDDILALYGLDQNQRAAFIDAEEIFTLQDLSVFTSYGIITAMATNLAKRTITDGRVILKAKHVKRLQTVVWWIQDRIKLQLPLDAAELTPAALAAAAPRLKLFCAELEEREPSISDLGKFHPNDYDQHKDAFLNLLAQTYGVLHKPLRYIVCFRFLLVSQCRTTYQVR
jgi:hypothetical protein